MLHFKSAVVALSVGLAFASGFSQLANAYDNFTDLGAGEALGINNLGQVVGFSDDPNNSAYQAVLWNGTTPIFLGNLGGNSQANSINNTGQIVGSSLNSSKTVNQAILWNSTTTPTILGGQGAGGGANAINNVGQVVGSITGGQATLWKTTNALTVLGGIGGTFTNAIGINSSGQVVGYSYNPGDVGAQAVQWNGTSTPTILGGLGGTISSAAGINNSGQVVGLSYSSGDATEQAVLWNGTSTPTVLSGLGGTWSVASAINNSGLAVGYSYNFGVKTGLGRAVMWTLQNGGSVVTDLNTLINPALGFTLEVATAINDKGQIVGYGKNSLGQTDAFELTFAAPVPEPETYEMMLIGLGLIGYMVRRKKKT